MFKKLTFTTLLLLFTLTVSQQRTPDLRLFSLAKKSGMVQCTSNTLYLVMPPSSPSLKLGVTLLVTDWKHISKEICTQDMVMGKMFSQKNNTFLVKLVVINCGTCLVHSDQKLKLVWNELQIGPEEAGQSFSADKAISMNWTTMTKILYWRLVSTLYTSWPCYVENIWISPRVGPLRWLVTLQASSSLGGRCPNLHWFGHLLHLDSPPDM